MKVLVLADSRGRDLEEKLNESGVKIEFKVEVSPGASMRALIQRLSEIAEGNNNGPNYQLIVILGGICSITKIKYLPYRAAVPRENSVEELMLSFNAELELLYKKQLTISIILAPIVGIDFIRYAGHWSEELYQMQPLIDIIIPMVNRRMIELNDNNGLPTPNTSSCVHHCRGKGRGYRTHYQKLSDGCHPGEEVKGIWAKALCECCKIFFKMS